MGKPELSLVDAGSYDVCGAPTADGSPCQRPAGSDGTCWEPTHAVRANPDLPDVPDHLGKPGQKCWRYYVEKCLELGVLHQIDLTVIEKASECYEMGMNCWKAAQQGPTIRGRDGTKKKNPAVGKHKEYATEYRQYAKEIGRLMAAARPEKEEGDESPWGDTW